MKRSIPVFVAAAAAGLAAGMLGAYLLRGRPWEKKPPAELRQAASRQETPLPEPPQEENPAEPEPESQPPEQAEPEKTGFWLKSEGDCLVVLEAGGGTPVMVYEVNPRLLPEQDRKRLEEGIFAATGEELARLIEDYIS